MLGHFCGSNSGDKMRPKHRGAGSGPLCANYTVACDLAGRINSIGLFCFSSAFHCLSMKSPKSDENSKTMFPEAYSIDEALKESAAKFHSEKAVCWKSGENIAFFRESITPGEKAVADVAELARRWLTEKFGLVPGGIEGGTLRTPQAKTRLRCVVYHAGDRWRVWRAERHNARFIMEVGPTR